MYRDSHPFEARFSRQVVAEFEGSGLSTKGDALLLRQADRKLGLLRRVARCFTDYRQPERIEHRLEEMLAQRVYGLALGYEYRNDHEQLPQDALLGVMAGKRDLGAPRREKYSEPAGIAARRFPRNRTLQHKIASSPAAIDELLVTLLLESHRKASRSIAVDLDATDRPLAWEAGSALLPWLLQPLLLSAAVHFLCPPIVVCSVAAFEPRCQCREARGGATDGQADSESLAAYADHPASELRVLSRGTDGLVRKTRGGLRLWLCTEPSACGERSPRKCSTPTKKEQQRTGAPARVFIENSSACSVTA